MKRLLVSISIIACIGIVYLGSYGVILNNYLHAPPERYYYGAEEGAFDILGNLTSIQQGMHGHIFHRQMVTTILPATTSFVKQEYMLIGHLGRLLRLSPLFSYYLARLVLSLSLCFLCVYIIKKLIPGSAMNQLLMLLLSIYNTGVILRRDGYSIMERMFFDTLVFQRMTLSKPHYLISLISTILSLWFLAKAINKPERVRFFILASIFGCITGYVYAPGLLHILLSIPVFGWIYSIVHLHHHHISYKQLWTMLICFSCISLISILIIQYALTYQSPYVINMALEKTYTFSLTPLEYILSIGPMYIIALLSIPLVIKNRNTFLLLIMPWLIVHPVSIFLISDLIHINKLRFYVSPYFFFFGILASYGIIHITSYIKEKFRLPKCVSYCIICSLIFLLSLVSYTDSIQKNSVCYCKTQFYDWVYPYRYMMEGIWWLRDHTEDNDIVLSDFFAGALITAFSGNTAYTTEWFRLIDYPLSKRTMIDENLFYSGTLSNDAAYKFLKQWSISYVYFSDQEKLYSEGVLDELPYPFLKEVMNNGKTIIYAVE